MSPPSDGLRQGERLRLRYLDGLRGLAAFWVVLHHAFLEVAAVPGWLPASFLAATRWAWNGQVAVQVFIVLSGYCLMLPVARAGHLKEGWKRFMLRRARRILPPYYAALLGSLAVIALVPGMNTTQGLRWDLSLPAFTPGALLSHALLLQDTRQKWLCAIDYPMWSIAQEWHIYFLFAVLLIPLWRRAGIVSTVVIAFVVSLWLRHFWNNHFFFAAPEFLFLFSVGMLAATINFPGLARPLAWVQQKTPWTLLFVGFWVACIASTLMWPNEANFRSMPFAVLTAGAMLCTLVACTHALQRQTRNLIVRACEWQPLAICGAFSYSLYLVHAPILGMFSLALRHNHVAGLPAVAVELLVAVPVAVVFAYGFHVVAERPFMLGHPRTLERTEKAAILDPAP